MDVKVTPTTLRKKKPVQLPERVPMFADKVLRWNDKDIQRHWRKVVKPEKY